jgi:uncharacterized protein YoxC
MSDSAYIPPTIDGLQRNNAALRGDVAFKWQQIKELAQTVKDLSYALSAALNDEDGWRSQGKEALGNISEETQILIRDECDS